MSTSALAEALAEAMIDRNGGEFVDEATAEKQVDALISRNMEYVRVVDRLLDVDPKQSFDLMARMKRALVMALTGKLALDGVDAAIMGAS